MKGSTKVVGALCCLWYGSGILINHSIPKIRKEMRKTEIIDDSRVYDYYNNGDWVTRVSFKFKLKDENTLTIIDDDLFDIKDIKTCIAQDYQNISRFLYNPNFFAVSLFGPLCIFLNPRIFDLKCDKSFKKFIKNNNYELYRISRELKEEYDQKEIQNKKQRKIEMDKQNEIANELHKERISNGKTTKLYYMGESYKGHNIITFEKEQKAVNYNLSGELYECDVVVGNLKKSVGYRGIVDKSRLYRENFDSTERHNSIRIYDFNQVKKCNVCNYWNELEQKSAIRIKDTPSTTLYHQTNNECAINIIHTEKMKPGSDGLAGAGIYFASTEAETYDKAHRKGIVLECEVLLGNTLDVGDGNGSISRKKLLFDGYDSASINRWSGIEYVVYDPHQIKSCKIITFNQ